MIFDKAALGPHRAAATSALLDPDNGWVTHNAVVTLTGDVITFDATKGILWWIDSDGEHRHLNLPNGITVEAVAGLMEGLRAALPTWRYAPA